MSLNDNLNQQRFSLYMFICIGVVGLLLSTTVDSVSGSGGNTNPLDPKYLTPIERELLRRSKAAEIKSWLDSSVEPCDNFYDFVCGNWRRINRADGKDESSRGPGPLRGMAKRVWDFLNTPKLRVLDSPESKVNTFYESCRKIVKDTCLYEASLRNMTDEIGEFSFLKKKGSSKRQDLPFQWWVAVAKVYSFYGKSLILSATIDYDLKDKNQAAIYLREPPKLLTSSKTYDMLRSHYSATPEQAQKVTENVKEFEEALAEVRYEFSSHKHSPVDEYTMYNRIDVQELFKDFFNMDTFLMVSFNSTDLPNRLYVQNNKYFENVANLLRDINMDIIEDYILLGVLQEFPVVHEDSSIDVWCSANTRQYFMKYFEHIVYQQYRSAEFEKDLYELWYEIKAVFLSELQGGTFHWMSKQTREQAIRKLKSLTFIINSYDDIDFEKFYKNLQISSINYVINTQNILRHSQKRHKGNHLSPKFIDKSADENLYQPMYFSRLNQFKVPVATLQPFETWHAAYPHAIKYARLGFILAREMLHAFDDYHRHFDAEGQLNNWWDATAINEYESRLRCFQAQYHNFTQADTDFHGENIADCGAVKIAYTAYLRWVEWAQTVGANINTHESFTNLPYNYKELFFISFGQQWCAEGKDGDSDADSVRKFRANGPLINFPMFSEVFKCLAKSPLNPVKKCAIF